MLTGAPSSTRAGEEANVKQGSRISTVAIVQQPPVLLNLAEGLERAADYVQQAAGAGAELVVFPETWLTGYPAWVFGMAGWRDEEAQFWYARLLAESPVLHATGGIDDGLAPLRLAAQDADVTVVMGLNERARLSAGTLYNSLITIGPDGRTMNLHRKLTPTHTERIVWGQGDAAGLSVVNTTAGRVGGLVCWEHWQPLARQALHAQDEEIHVAAWPDMPEMHHVASRAYAFEGRCFVVCAGQFLSVEDVPSDIREAFRAGVGADAPETGILFDGGSGVVRPDGTWLAPPLFGSPGIIVQEIDLAERDQQHHDLDVVGHYSRPDVFNLTVHRSRPGTGVDFSDVR